MDRLSWEYIGDFAMSAAAAAPRIVLALYDHPQQWRDTLADLREELRYYEVAVVELPLEPGQEAPSVDKWLEIFASATQHERLFVAGEVASLPDDRFESLFQAMEQRRELIVGYNRGTLLLSLTPERVAELTRRAPSLYSIVDVVRLKSEKFHLPDDLAYEADREILESELKKLESQYGFKSADLWQKMAKHQCAEIPPRDLRRWQRLVEALRAGEGDS